MFYKCCIIKYEIFLSSCLTEKLHTLDIVDLTLSVDITVRWIQEWYAF